MPSSFGGIEIASRALSAYQSLIDVTGHNIANVDTPGYTRQRGEIAATPPDSAGLGDEFVGAQGQIGTGVALQAVTGVRDLYLDARIQGAARDQGQANTLRDTLQRVQVAFGEPGTGGISDLLGSFFNSFQALATNPQDSAARVTVKNQAVALAARFNSLTQDLTGAATDVAGQIQDRLKQADGLAKQVADLNGQIRTILARGDQASDLVDKRDAIVQQLGTLVGAQSTPVNGADGSPTGMVNLSVGGFGLVQGTQSASLPRDVTTAGGKPALQQGGDVYPLTGGEISGLAAASSSIAGYQADLDTLASTIVSQVNALHRTGYGLDGQTGQDLFVGSDAASMKVSDAIAADPRAIAAAAIPAAGQAPAAGNGDNARAIADLANASILNGGTLSAFYGAKVSQLGMDVQNASQQADNQAQVSQQLQNLRSSVSGVSLDEELTHMVEYQRSYQAAARLMTVMDSMLDRVINGMGV